jgi:hypothetical protein
MRTDSAMSLFPFFFAGTAANTLQNFSLPYYLNQHPLKNTG